jgi:hypothetical protein
VSYVEDSDLLLGELVNSLPPTIDIAEYLSYAAEEIDSKLGVLYKVPVDIDQLPNSQGSLIRSIHRKLCSGRIIMAATVAHSNMEVHGYAMRLVKEALMELMAVANGDVVLVGAERVNGDGQPRGDIPDAEIADPRARVPGANNRDEVSGVRAFEINFMTPGVEDVRNWYPGMPERSF